MIVHEDEWSHPVAGAVLIQRFGANRSRYQKLGQLGHNGLDYAAPEGTEVVAAVAGTVIHAGWCSDHPWLTHHAGVAILIHHGEYFTGYAHLSWIHVTEGQPVAAGELIGEVGKTGTAGDVPHLHFEVIRANPDFGNGYAGRVEPPTFEHYIEPA